ncbi:hypothetical protein BK709_09785 [Bacillus thuringiensis serovar shandongiensis]|nr:hypothetical protein BK717_03085 [Bacillus thuringiensis serovar malayensis]OUB08320.1 hypothetical protein BK709_09785 [Bacillus thuringiensis serovar shandongiensis]
MISFFMEFFSFSQFFLLLTGFFNILIKCNPLYIVYDLLFLNENVSITFSQDKFFVCRTNSCQDAKKEILHDLFFGIFFIFTIFPFVNWTF